MHCLYLFSQLVGLAEVVHVEQLSQTRQCPPRLPPLLLNHRPRCRSCRADLIIAAILVLVLAAEVANLAHCVVLDAADEVLNAEVFNAEILCLQSM